MKASKRSWWFCSLFFTAFALLLLFGAACKKSTPKKSTSAESPVTPLSPEAAQQQRQQVLDWNLITTVKAYEQAGHTSPKWDEAAKRALTEYARFKSKAPGADTEMVSINVEAAIQAGCDDPLVNYVFIKFGMSQTNSKEAFTAAFYKTALAMEASSYPPIRKFYAGFRAVQQYGWANNYPTNWPEEMKALYHRMIDQLSATIADANTPAPEIYDACHEFLNNEGRNTEYYPKYWESMEPLVFNHWGDDSTIWLLKGEANVRLAWLARGDGLANTVTEEGWKKFKEHLDVAETALERAWEINPHDTRIPTEMMNVMLGQGGGRERMEAWFERAMEVDTNCYDICYNKLYYLEPKWYGSDAEQIAFGRECVRSTKWGGRVPFTLLDAHIYINNRNPKSEQDNYWKDPDVWADVQSSFERFFELNPDATNSYPNYAWYAYHAEQWVKLNELLPKLGTVNPDLFGGKVEYEKMVSQAKEHTSPTGRQSK